MDLIQLLPELGRAIRRWFVSVDFFVVGIF